jgi:hypothetical protein
MVYFRSMLELRPIVVGRLSNFSVTLIISLFLCLKD